MFIDSQLAWNVLRYFTGQGIPVLPVHDSFIVDSDHEGALRAFMEDATTYLLGAPFETSTTVPDGMLEAGGGVACKVATTRMLAPLIREIVVDLPEGMTSDFEAGDFMQITAPPYALDFATLDVPPGFAQAWDIAGWHRLRAGSDAEVTRAYLSHPGR